MAFRIEEIKSQLTFGGARQSLFQVQFNNPANSIADVKLPFLCKASSLPASTLGNISVPYFGRKINLAGDRSFEQWSITVINDEDFLIRNAMEQWTNSISSLEGNLRQFGSASPLLYKTDAKVIQFSKTGIPIREYTFHGIYPASVASINLSWADTDQIEEFGVTFQYDWWDVTGGITGNAGGN